LKNAFINDNTIPNKKAVKKPETPKPGTSLEASIINNAFMTSEKRPSVKIVIGRAIIFTIGLIKIFMTPRTTAKTRLLPSVTVTPGTTLVAIIMAKAETNKCIMIFISSHYTKN